MCNCSLQDRQVHKFDMPSRSEQTLYTWKYNTFKYTNRGNFMKFEFSFAYFIFVDDPRSTPTTINATWQHQALGSFSARRSRSNAICKLLYLGVYVANRVYSLARLRSHLIHHMMSPQPMSAHTRPSSPTSGPNEPPVHRLGPVCWIENICVDGDAPLTANPYSGPWNKFQVRCKPMEIPISPVSR